MANQDKSVVSELDKKLDTLFDDAFSGDASGENPAVTPIASEIREKQKSVPQEKRDFSSQKTPARTDPLETLNVLLLSLDWELDDTTLARYLEEIHQSRYAFLEEKIIVHFFQMLDSLGRYLNSRKVKAHPETIRIMQEIQAGLGKILDTGKKISEEEKKAVLKIAYKRFQTFKELVVAAPSQEKPGKRQNGSEKTVAMPSSTENALRKMIRGILREELENFRQQLLKDLLSARKARR